MDLTESLRAYLDQHVSAFQNIEVIGEGTAFHYTPHGKNIRKSGGFLGAPINPNLAATQDGPISTRATDPDGVVFAYLQQETAVAEGRGPEMELFEIRFRRAISAIQVNDAEMHVGIGRQPVPQILVVASEILGFESRGLVEDYYPKI